MIPALRDRTVAVLFGGRSGEREVSLSSAASVIAALRQGGYAPREIDTGAERWWDQLAGVHMAFNVQHGRGGEDGVTQGLLESMGIACTGSDVLGSALAMDKVRSKRLWRDAGLPTADFALVDETTDADALLADWGCVFIKPACEGSSLGMTRLTDAANFGEAYRAARAQDATVLAERFIDGPEYTVAILGDRALPAIRIEVDAGFYDYQAKYRSDTTRYLIPCGLDKADQKTLAELSLAAFDCLGCSVWGRVDVMRASDGSFQLLEVNTVPGMTDHSLVPMAAEAAGLSLPELLDEVLGLSLAAWEAAHG